ncbi:hypothetical protein FACUT_11484 [Fusarium acutatum]|uniref:Uncharacterized protein n=1 Tax=Fusarium acutatum TaxID=78861 RepID=A0A8H4JDA4_9HYPO|nr:hypothetical protein FACUT_11484 [Fusarium acutatum]
MSGFEILGAIASSIALAQAVKGTVKAINFLRQASEMKKECDRLKSEILMIDYLIARTREQTDPMMPAQRLLGSAEYPIVSLVTQELEGILEELKEIVKKYSRSGMPHDRKRYTDKMKWLSDASKIEELRERAQATKSNLHTAITFRVSSMVDRGNMRQEVEGFAYFPDDVAGGVWPLLLISLRNQSSDTMEILLKLWKNILPTATEGGVLDALREQPWAIDELNEYGEAPIHVSIGYNNFGGFEQLIAANADINRQTGFGNTPLMRASYYGRDTMVKKLLGYSECRRRIGQSTAVGQTALHFAVQSESATCVRLLLEAGASALKLNQLGETPMHRLAWGEQDGQQEIYEIIELLKAHGADIESKNRDGWTPMLWACAKGNVPVLRALVRAGGSLSAISSHRQGILHRAACSNNFDIVHCLAEQDLEDIDPQLRDLSQGETPLGSLNSLIWILGKCVVPSDPMPTPDQQKSFIKLYFDLLIRDLERHMLTLRNIQEAIQDRDPKTTTELLHILVKRNEASFRQGLVDWYRGFIFYVSDGKWDHLKQAICDEYNETSEKAKRAAVAREKTMADPEMKEFF